MHIVCAAVQDRRWLLRRTPGLIAAAVPAGWLVKSFAWEVLIRRKAAGSGRRQATSMDTNRADPRLIWLVAVLTAMVVVVFLAQS